MTKLITTPTVVQVSAGHSFSGDCPPSETGVARRGPVEAAGGSWRADPFDRDAIGRIIWASGDEGAGRRFMGCCEGGRGWVGRCVDCGHEVYHPSSCELRICPRCSARRSKELRMELTQGVKELTAKAPWPYSLKHITLTTNVCLVDYFEYDPATQKLNVERLAELGEIARGLRVKIREMFQERFKGYRLTGGGIGTEFGPGGLILHFHVLALCPFYPHRELSDDWKRWGGEYARYGVVYIQRADGAGRTEVDIEKTVGYVSKYVTKPIGRKHRESTSTEHVRRVQALVSEFGQEPFIAAVHFVFKGMRRFQTFGTFFDMGIAEDEAPEACPKCGGKLFWRPELEVLRSEATGVLNSFSADNSIEHDGSDPPQRWQMRLFGLD